MKLIFFNPVHVYDDKDATTEVSNINRTPNSKGPKKIEEKG